MGFLTRVPPPAPLATATPAARVPPRGGVAASGPGPPDRGAAPSPQRNWARKRRSFWKNRRRSSMSYLIMAIRSIPMPKAKPETTSGS